jgi:hypothetical protein
MIDAGKMLDVRAVLVTPDAPPKGKPAAPPAPAKAAAPAPAPSPAATRTAAAPKGALVPSTKADKESPMAKAKEPEPPRDKPAATASADKAGPKKKAPNLTLPDEEPPPKHVGVDKPADKPAAGSGEGYLRVGSKPWTNIIVDGKDTGLHTPQTRLKLAAGSHRITLTNPQANIKETFSVEIRSGETETVIKDLRAQGSDNND